MLMFGSLVSLRFAGVGVAVGVALIIFGIGE